MCYSLLQTSKLREDRRACGTDGGDCQRHTSHQDVLLGGSVWWDGGQDQAVCTACRFKKAYDALSKHTEFCYSMTVIIPVNEAAPHSVITWPREPKFIRKVWEPIQSMRTS